MKRMCSMCYEIKDENNFKKYKHTVNNKIYINTDSYCINCRKLYDRDMHSKEL